MNGGRIIQAVYKQHPGSIQAAYKQQPKMEKTTFPQPQYGQYVSSIQVAYKQHEKIFLWAPTCGVEGFECRSHMWQASVLLPLHMEGAYLDMKIS